MKKQEAIEVLGISKERFDKYEIDGFFRTYEMLEESELRYNVEDVVTLYASINGVNFSEALYNLKKGMKLTRREWYDDGKFIVIMPELQLPRYSIVGDKIPKVNARTALFIGEDTDLNSQPYIAMYTKSSNLWQPGWTPSVQDLFAEDWYDFDIFN